MLRVIAHLLLDMPQDAAIDVFGGLRWDALAGGRHDGSPRSYQCARGGSGFLGSVVTETIVRGTEARRARSNVGGFVATGRKRVAGGISMRAMGLMLLSAATASAAVLSG